MWFYFFVIPYFLLFIWTTGKSPNWMLEYFFGILEIVLEFMEFLKFHNNNFCQLFTPST